MITKTGHGFRLRLLPFFLGAIFSYVLSSHRSAYAIDPFTILAAGNAALNLAQSVGGSSKGSSELRDVFGALGELNDEILPADGKDDSYRIARKIEAIENAAMEAGYTKDEVDSILSGARSSNQNLSQAVRLLTRSIRLGKRVVGMAALGAATGGAGAAAAGAGSMQGQDQQKKILTDIYSQILNSSLDQKKEEVDRQKAIQTQYKNLRKYVLSIAPGGNLAMFPIDSSIIQKAINVYKSYYWILLGLVGALFFGRIVYYQFSWAPPEQYADLIRELLVCYFLMLAFPYVYSYMAECSEALSIKLGQLLHVTGAQMSPDALPIDKTSWFWWFRIDVFPLVLYAAAHIVFNFVIGILIAFGPIAVLVGTMMNFPMAIPAYFGLLVFVWLWPALWNVLGYFKNLLWTESGAGSVIAASIMFIFQLLSPLVIYSMLKGTHAGQAIHSATGSVKKRVGALSFGSDGGDQQNAAAAGAVAGAAGGPGAASAGAAVGSMAAAGAGKVTSAAFKAAVSAPMATGRLLYARQQRKRQGIQIGSDQYRMEQV